VCGSSTTSNVALVVSRVYADSRFFIVVVVVVVIIILLIIINGSNSNSSISSSNRNSIDLEVNHECQQNSPTTGHFDHSIVIVIGRSTELFSFIINRTKSESPVRIREGAFCHLVVVLLINSSSYSILSISMLRREKIFIASAIGRINFNDWLYSTKQIDKTKSFFQLIVEFCSTNISTNSNNNNEQIIVHNPNQLNKKTSSTWKNGLSLCFLRFIKS